jgi:hypothetical protein
MEVMPIAKIIPITNNDSDDSEKFIARIAILDFMDFINEEKHTIDFAKFNEYCRFAGIRRTKDGESK